MFFKVNSAKTAERPDRLSGEFLARYSFACRFVKKKKVLDIGTGLGEGAYYLATRGASEVLGIDYSESAIKYARRTFQAENLKFEVMNALALSFTRRSFDVITAFELIEHLPPPQHASFLERIAGILRSGGVFVISTPNKLISSPGRRKPYNPYHYKEFVPGELRELLRRHFFKVSLMGLCCTNMHYLEQQKKLNNTWRYRMLVNFGQYRVTRELLAFIPKTLKRIVTSERQLPLLRASDFKISSKRINQCENLLAVCRKR